MRKIENTDFPFYRFENLSACPGIGHFVSSGRKNIGFIEGADPLPVWRNRQMLGQTAGFDARRLVTGQQVHSTCIAVVTDREAGRGAMNRESRLPATDALVTDRPGICLMVLSADCVPVLLYDPHRQVVAAIHAGWRGTAGEIAARTVQVMQEKFGCSPEEIWAGIGPSIGKCCFEVEEEVVRAFQHLFPDRETVVSAGRKPGKYQVDLWEANRLELQRAGLLPENIEIAGLCTVCHPDRFFSYRRDGQAAGRFGAGIVLC